MDTATAAPTTLAASRIRRFLEKEPVVWLSTVRPDGNPHLVSDLVLVGRRGGPRLLEAERAEGSQPPREPVGDARARRRRGGLRRRDASRSRRAPAGPDRRTSCRPNSSPSIRRGSRHSNCRPPNSRRPTTRSSGSSRTSSSGGTAERRREARGSPVRQPSRSTSRDDRTTPGSTASRSRAGAHANASRRGSSSRPATGVRSESALPETVVRGLRELGRGFGEPSLGTRRGVFGEPSLVGA